VTSRAVELPNQAHIAGAQPTHHFIKHRACSFRSAGNIPIDALAAGKLERIHLQVKILIPRIYARSQFLRYWVSSSFT